MSIFQVSVPISRTFIQYVKLIKSIISAIVEKLCAPINISILHKQILLTYCLAVSPRQLISSKSDEHLIIQAF